MKIQIGAKELGSHRAADWLSESHLSAPQTLLIRLQIRLKPNPPDHKGANMGLSYGAAVSQRGLVKLPFIGGSPTHQVQPTPPLQIVQYLIANSCQSVGL